MSCKMEAWAESNPWFIFGWWAWSVLLVLAMREYVKARDGLQDGRRLVMAATAGFAYLAGSTMYAWFPGLSNLQGCR